MPEHVALTVLWHAITQMRTDPVIDHRRFLDGIALDGNTAQQHEAASFQQFFADIAQDRAECWQIETAPRDIDHVVAAGLGRPHGVLKFGEFGVGKWAQPLGIGVHVRPVPSGWPFDGAVRHQDIVELG